MLSALPDGWTGSGGVSRRWARSAPNDSFASCQEALDDLPPRERAVEGRIALQRIYLKRHGQFDYPTFVTCKHVAQNRQKTLGWHDHDMYRHTNLASSHEPTNRMHYANFFQI
jgi:hypothetical protein